MNDRRPEPRPIPEPLRGRSRRRQMAFGVDPSTDLGGFVVTRADISERKVAEAARARSQGAAAAGARRLPHADPHVVDRGRDALSQSRQPGALRGPPDASSTTIVDPTIAKRSSTRCSEKGGIDDFRVRSSTRTTACLLGFDFGAPDRIPGPAGDRFQHHEHHRHDRGAGADPAGQRAAGRRHRIAGRRVSPSTTRTTAWCSPTAATARCTRSAPTCWCQG